MIEGLEDLYQKLFNAINKFHKEFLTTDLSYYSLYHICSYYGICVSDYLYYERCNSFEEYQNRCRGEILC